MRVVSRKEKKFLVDLAGAKKLEGILASVVAPDPHNGLQGYPIRSLYFDTLHDRDYAEKLMGTDPRRKVRLRVYGIPRQTSRCSSSNRSREITSASARFP